MSRPLAWEHPVGLVGCLLLLAGTFIGLFLTPPERYQGEVQRILYVHVPCAWAALLCYTTAFVAGIGSLLSGARRWDATLAGAVETGCVFNALLLVQGMSWARGTWGVWWDWDVRLTTSLVLLVLFVGVLALRAFIEDPGQRASWSAIAAIVSFVDVPLVWLCVRWWRSLHQIQSSPTTIDRAILIPWAVNASALVLIATWLVTRRARLELRRRDVEEVAEPARRELVHA